MSDLPQAAPATRRVPLCLDAEAESEWVLARRAVKAGKDDAEQWEQEAAVKAGAATVVVVVRALSFPEVQDVLDDHPPRIVDGEYDRLDLSRGYNRRTYKPALVHAAIDSPDLDAAKWTTLLRQLTAGQFRQLSDAVEGMASRRTPDDLPFESAASD